MKTLHPDSIRWYIDEKTWTKLGSVTSILQLLDDDPFIEKWKNSLTVEEYLKYMEKVYERGTLIHKMCEYHFKGEFLPIPLNPEYQCYINGFHRFLALHQHEIVPIGTEHTMASTDIGMAGTTDFICEWTNLKTLVDWKTSSSSSISWSMKERYRMQTAGYVKIYEMLHPGFYFDQAIIVPLTSANKSWLGKFEVMNRDMIDQYWEKFKPYILDFNLIYNGGFIPNIFK